MKTNQNETKARFLGIRRQRRAFAVSQQTRTSRLAPRVPKLAFTLTELLVVITIIAVLASLVTVAVANALRKAKEAAIVLEIQQFETALEDFKNDYGAYPPNATNPYGRNYNNDRIADIVQSNFERMFKRAFPRSQESVVLINAMAGIQPPNNNIVTSGELPGGMTANEALVFWLGGFSSDPQYPLSGPGGPSFVRQDGSNNPPIASDDRLEEHNWRFEFDLGRLGPRTDEGLFDEIRAEPGRFIVYVDPINGAPRRINFWRYTPGDSEIEVAYIDVSRNKPAEYDVDMTGNVINGNLFALKKLREGITTPQNYDDIRYVNEGKFQILHCGIDDAWGDFSIFRMPQGAGNLVNGTYFPTGPFIGDIADTLGNFGTGKGKLAEQE